MEMWRLESSKQARNPVYCQAPHSQAAMRIHVAVFVLKRLYAFWSQQSPERPPEHAVKVLALVR